MKDYRINPAATLRYEGNLFIAEGRKSFNVVKITEAQALTLKHSSEQKWYTSFAAALDGNNITNAQPLAEGEFYNGYVAVWKGSWIQACRLIGSLQIASDPRNWIWADSRLRELLPKGELLEPHTTWREGEVVCCGVFKEVSAICGYWGHPYLQEREIGRRLKEAVLNHDGIIALEDEEVKELLAFSAAFTSGALVLPA